jgi:hypothetical protein
MANLTQINPITKKTLNQLMSDTASKVYSVIEDCQETYDVINGLTGAEITNMPSGSTDPDGYDAASATQIGAFRVSLLNMIEAFNSTTKTGSGVPATYIKAFKRFLV